VLKKYYSRVTAKENKAKKDGMTGVLVVSPRWRMSSSSSGGDCGYVQQSAQARVA
jgi:hypothetical protein